MKHSVILPILCCLLIGMGATRASAEPSAKVDGNSVRITEGVTDATLGELKKETIKEGSRFVFINVDTPEELAKVFAAYPDISSLSINSDKLTSIAPVAALKKLAKASFHCAAVGDFAPLSGLTDLNDLEIKTKAPTAALKWPSGLTGLKRIIVRSPNIGPDLKWMSDMSSLSAIVLEAGKNLVSFEGIPASAEGMILNGAAPANLDPLKELSKLESLRIQDMSMPDMTPLGNLPKLGTLHFTNAQVKDFSPLASCPALRLVAFVNVTGMNFSTLSKLTSVRYMESDNSGMSDLAWIVGMTGLQTIKLKNEAIKDFSPLAKTNLTQLELNTMKTPIGDMSALGGMKNLFNLTLRSVEGATHLDVVKNLTALTELIMVKVNTKGG